MLSKLYEERLRHDIFRLSVLSLVTVLIWVGVATYRTLSKSEVESKIKKQIKPLTAELSVDTMENITSRQQIVEADWDSLRPATGEVLVLPEPTASSSGQVASPEGELEAPEASN